MSGIMSNNWNAMSYNSNNLTCSFTVTYSIYSVKAKNTIVTSSNYSQWVSINTTDYTYSLNTD